MAQPTISFRLDGPRRSAPTSPVDEGPVTLTGTSQAVVVVIAVPAAGSDVIDSAGIELGGVALTRITDAGTNGLQVWWLDDLSGNSSGDHLVVDWNTGQHAQATCYVLDHADPLQLVDAGEASGPGTSTPSVNLSGSATDALGLGTCGNNGFGAGLTTGPDLVVDNSFDFASQRAKTFHDPTSPLTAHASGVDGTTLFINLAAFSPLPSPDVHFTPDPFGIEAGVTAGVAFGPGADVMLLPARFGIEAGVRSQGLAFGVAGPRQVHLVGGSIETPEMTTGGTEGQVLTYHEGTVPTWETNASSGPEATMLWRPVGSGDLDGTVLIDGDGVVIMAYGPA